MIGFTFSMALNRFEARRDALVSEANAIGTAALRARLLPAPYGEESLKLFKDYARIRVSFAELEQTSEESVKALRRSKEIQEALWRQAQGAAEKDNAMVPTGLYIQALNETFDNQQKRLTIVGNRVPSLSRSTLLQSPRFGSPVSQAQSTGGAGACRLMSPACLSPASSC